MELLECTKSFLSIFIFFVVHFGHFFRLFFYYLECKSEDDYVKSFDVIIKKENYNFKNKIVEYEMISYKHLKNHFTVEIYDEFFIMHSHCGDVFNVLIEKYKNYTKNRKTIKKCLFNICSSLEVKKVKS